MTIGHPHQPIGLAVLLCAVALAVRHDAASLPTALEVAFVGKFDPPDDASFAGFSAAWARVAPGGPTPMTLSYHAGGDSDRQRLEGVLRMATERQPAVLVLPDGEAAQAAKAVKVDVPIVFATYPDPIRTGLVASLRQPGQRSTGVWLGDLLHVKRLELLKDAFPHVRTVALLADTSWLSTRDIDALVEYAAHRLDVRLLIRVADTPEALDRLLGSPDAVACDAWYVPSTYIAYVEGAKIIEAMKRLRTPAIYAWDDVVAKGALMAYSQDTRFAYAALADLARRVALGEDAGSIPVQRPYRYTLSVRIEPDAPWARIEPSVVRRADRVHRP
jgi:putative tryptophan/tyrosine transport system substrate-binding protein